MRPGRLLTFLMTGLIIVSFAGCSKAQDKKLQLNKISSEEQAKIEQLRDDRKPFNYVKVIGSDNPIMDKAIIQSIKELSKVISDGTLLTENMPPMSDKEKEKLTSMFGSVPKESSMQFTVFEVQVDEVLYGEVKSKTIKVRQVGSPNSDQGETKLKKNNEMFFFLEQPDSLGGLYRSADQEHGLFIIIDTDRIISMSNYPGLSYYDGLKSEVLRLDILKAIESKKE